jgi:Mg-chelatase subunit ChlD
MNNSLMFNKIKIFFVLWGLCFLFAVGAVAAPPPESGHSAKAPTVQGPVPPKPHQPKEKEGIDLIFILDCSGSMKKTDPQVLRKPATELFFSLLGARDRIGLVSFGGLAQTLFPLTENSSANQRSFSLAVQQHINSEALNTNLYEAVKKGYEEIKGSSKATKILLLMSDGHLDLGAKDKDAAALKELFALMPNLAGANIKLYTVAFTDLSDQKLLADLAEKTKGFFQMAKTDKDLHIIFSKIFEQLKVPDSVPLEGDTFLVDKDIQEITVLITRQQGTASRLIAPSRRELVYGKVPENVNWFQTPAFDLITIKNPIPGRWKVYLSSKEGNKIFVVTDLALKTSFNQNQIPLGQQKTIETWLEREDKRITEKRFLESMFVMAEIRDPKGQQIRLNLYPRENGDQGDKKGIFSSAFVFKDLGNYSIKILADGKTFRRELIRQVQTVSQAVPQSSPAAVHHKPPSGHSDDLWAKAIKTFLLLNGGLVLLVVLTILAIKWKVRRAGRSKKPKKEKKAKKEKGAS